MENEALTFLLASATGLIMAFTKANKRIIPFGFWFCLIGGVLACFVVGGYEGAFMIACAVTMLFAGSSKYF